MPNFWYRPFTEPGLRGSMITDNDGNNMAEIVGEIRSTKSEFPLCYVHSHTTAARIVNALNAQEAACTTSTAATRTDTGKLFPQSNTGLPDTSSQSVRRKR